MNAVSGDELQSRGEHSENEDRGVAEDGVAFCP